MAKKIYGMFILLSLFSTLLLASPVLANVGDNDFGMMGSFCGSNAGYGMMGLFGSIFMILITIILILVIIWLYKQVQEPKRKK